MADADQQGPPESPQPRPAGADGQDDGPLAAIGQGGRDRSAPAGAEAGPGPLLADLALLRHQTRAARHAYWFPLILFGLLTCAAAPLYVAADAPPLDLGAHNVGSWPILLSGLPIGTRTFYIGWYWAVALVGGYLLTLLWYRRHAGRAGVWTPARGYLITGVALTVLALAIPPLTLWLHRLSWVWLPFGDVWIRARSRS